MPQVSAIFECAQVAKKTGHLGTPMAVLSSVVTLSRPSLQAGMLLC